MFAFGDLLRAQSENGYIGRAIRNAGEKKYMNPRNAYREIGNGILNAILDDNTKVWDLTRTIDAARKIADHSTRLAILAGIGALSGRATD